MDLTSFVPACTSCSVFCLDCFLDALALFLDALLITIASLGSFFSSDYHPSFPMPCKMQGAGCHTDCSAAWPSVRNCQPVLITWWIFCELFWVQLVCWVGWGVSLCTHSFSGWFCSVHMLYGDAYVNTIAVSRYVFLCAPLVIGVTPFCTSLTWVS